MTVELELELEPSPLAGFGVTREELLEAAKPGSGYQGVRDGRICACGHPMTRHAEMEGRPGETIRTCTPTRMACPCKQPKAVVEAADTRPFLRKTRGHGLQHALMAGIAALEEKGKDWRWLDGWPKCELAGWPAAECDAGAGVQPYSFNARGLARPEPEAFTMMLCRAHGLVAIERGLS